MDEPDTREWLITNGLGGFASGTVCDARTRTYHGWLVASLNPPSQRTLLLSHLEASLEIDHNVFALGTNFWLNGRVSPQGYRLLRAFSIDPVPTWTWGEDTWQMTRQLLMPYALEPSGATLAPGDDAPAHFYNRLLIQYAYTGTQTARLRLRLLIGDRNFHYQHQADSKLRFSQLIDSHQVILQALYPDFVGTAWQLRWSRGGYQPEETWYWNYHYPEETLRGLADCEDFYSPGYLTVTLQPGETITLEARLGWSVNSHQAVINGALFEQALQAEQQRQQTLSNLVPRSTPVLQQLLRAGDQFIAYRASISGPTVIAGYPWFNDWGRDTLIALPGLALTTKRFDLAKGLLKTFGQYCHQGLIPNTFPDAGSQPSYNSLDAALWWIEILGLYLEATQDWDFLAEQYDVVQKIYKAFIAGTDYNIRVDASDGLLIWDAPQVALTWMDALIEGYPVTPRRGKPIEINALWYSALCWASQWAECLAGRDSEANPASLGNQARRYAQHAQQVKAGLQKFWNPDRNYLYDTIEPDDQPDAKIRPNAVLALSLHHCGFPDHQARQVLQVAQATLLTPYGLRSLEPTDPAYVSHYSGNSWYRDRAYHQGTVWSWLIGPFIRAWRRFHPDPLPFDWQPLIDHIQHEACLGSVSEIFDGDPPHQPQGAIAQAWSVAELIRCWSTDPPG